MGLSLFDAEMAAMHDSSTERTGPQWPTCPGAEDQEGAACQVCGVWSPWLQWVVPTHWDQMEPPKMPDIRQEIRFPDPIFGFHMKSRECKSY